MTVDIRYEAPPTEVFCALRRACGWGDLAPAVAEAALERSLINATIYVDERLAGFGRVVGDGVLYFHIQDVVIHQDFRGSGHATKLIEALVRRVLERAPAGSTIGLMATRGRESMYERFGFVARPTESYGAGMTLFVGAVDQ